MKTIKNSKEITTLEVGDKVVFGNLEYEVTQFQHRRYYYLDLCLKSGLHPGNNKIFNILNLIKEDFIAELGINANCNCSFPETKSLEALTAIVSALFKEWEEQKELPKTWEEFCERNPIKTEEFLIESNSSICISKRPGCTRDKFIDKNYFVSRQEAEAFLALMQLRQLRKAYIKDWKPDWMSDTEPKFCINLQANSFDVQCWYHMNNPFSFPTAELAYQFLNNFKDLLEIAKPLL